MNKNFQHICSSWWNKHESERTPETQQWQQVSFISGIVFNFLKKKKKKIQGRPLKLTAHFTITTQSLCKFWFLFVWVIVFSLLDRHTLIQLRDTHLQPTFVPAKIWTQVSTLGDGVFTHHQTFFSTARRRRRRRKGEADLPGSSGLLQEVMRSPERQGV